MHTSVHMLDAALHAQPYLLELYEDQHDWP